MSMTNVTKSFFEEQKRKRQLRRRKIPKRKTIRNRIKSQTKSRIKKMIQKQTSPTIRQQKKRTKQNKIIYKSL